MALPPRKGIRYNHPKSQYLQARDQDNSAAPKPDPLRLGIRGDKFVFKQMETMMTRRAAIYVRVSTDGQTTENQTRRLCEVASRAGWTVVAAYDETASGAAGPEKRTQYATMLKDAARRKFDVLMAWDVSRLGRSLAGLVALMEELRTLKVDLFIDQQGLDTTTPAGRAMFQMAGVFAEFERGMLIERTRAGMDRARARGIHVGRPSVGAEVEHRIAEMRASGVSINRIAATLHVGKSVVCRVCREVPSAMEGGIHASRL